MFSVAIRSGYVYQYLINSFLIRHVWGGWVVERDCFVQIALYRLLCTYAIVCTCNASAYTCNASVCTRNIIDLLYFKYFS